jgi:hypothetical protein
VSDLEIILTGPLLTNGGEPFIRLAMSAARQAEYAVGSQALADVQFYLNKFIKHPTPYYETQIHIERMDDLTISVNDRGVIYGPWLEGTSSRNQTTRFKGYASFRKALQKTESRVQQIVDPIYAHWLGA